MIKKARLKIFIFFLVFLLIYVPCVQAVTPQCIQPPDAIAPAEFNPDTGYCETYPISSNGTCPENYVFSDTAGECVSMPYCEGDYSYNFSTRQCEKISYTSFSSEEGFYLQEGVYYCAFDSNGNGDVEQNEIDECIQTEQGYICPYSMTECNKKYQTPSCPAGYTYNPSTQKCEAEVVIGVCSSKTVQVSDYLCPENNQVYSDLNQCNSNCVQTAYCSSTVVCKCSANVSYDKKHVEASPNSWTNFVYIYWDGDCHVLMSLYFDSQCNITRWRKRYCAYYGWPCRTTPGAYIYVPPGQFWSYEKNGRCGSQYCIENTSVCTQIYNCPLGDYPCTGDPPVCKKGSTCVTHTSTVTKWQCSLNGVQYDTQDQCTTNCHSACPPGGIYNSSTGKCEIDPACPENSTLDSNGCFMGYSCPLGNYQCQYVSSQGKWMCSPNKCFTTTDIQDDEPDVIPSGYQDDGEITEDGVCLGSIFIFNGYEMRCRPAGLQTGFQNCCDEAQGKIYDSTGSLSGTFTTVKNVIAAISASKQVAQIGYYATKIASGEYALQATGTGVAELVNTATGEVVTTYATDSAEAIALAQVDTGMSADVAVQTAGTTYISQLKADIALAIVNLAVSQVIDDPLVAATVNFAATLAVPYLFPGATISPVGLAFAAINIALAFFGGGCDKQDILTSTYKESGYCHYVGSKCIKKLPLVGCVQKAKVYCCFNSKLARIIHEQGRPQLANFQGNLWGSAKHPICRGFTPEEFQALDFSKMDLSEYYADIERNMTENLQQKITTQINETYEGLR